MSVYFVWASELGRVKIGYTGGDPKARLWELRTGSPDRLELLEVLPGGPDVERAFHAVFADARLHGEWFWPLPCLMERIGHPHLGRYMPDPTF